MHRLWNGRQLILSFYQISGYYDNSYYCNHNFSYYYYSYYCFIKFQVSGDQGMKTQFMDQLMRQGLEGTPLLHPGAHYPRPPLNHDLLMTEDMMLDHEGNPVPYHDIQVISREFPEILSCQNIIFWSNLWVRRLWFV